MKILTVHNYYQMAGGEDSVLKNEISLLSENGNDVEIYEKNNFDIKSISDKIRSTFLAPYSVSSKMDFSRKLVLSKPDIVHVHNFFPLITPSIFWACKELFIPVVMTVHNYRLLCVGASLYRNGHTCELCVGRLPLPGIIHGCYKGSRVGSSAIAAMQLLGHHMGTWQNAVDAFICLTQFSKEKLVAGGFPAEKIEVKPNFVKINTNISENNSIRNGALFVGRLTEEKGIKTLIKAWSSINRNLTIVGDGPLSSYVSDASNINTNIKFLGKQNSDTVQQLMRKSEILVVPSLWYEGFPMVICEAMANGLPIIGSNIGAMAELIQHERNGLLFEAGDADDLSRNVNISLARPDLLSSMGLMAKKDSREKYSPEANYNMLMDIYDRAKNKSK